MKNTSYIGISFIILIFGIWAVPKIVAKFQKSDLVTIGPVPDFKLTNQHNKTITNEAYKGKVYVVEFFFSKCPSICPIMNQNMLLLQDAFYGNPKFGIASITIDPETDTPAHLKEHAEELGVKNHNWHFLTADKTYIYNLANTGFNIYSGQNENAPGGFEHSGFVALIDKEGNIRCRKDAQGNPILYYDATEDVGTSQLKEDIEKLLEE